MLSVVIGGLIAGGAHVISGPDHLAALAPIAIDQPTKAAKLGFRWGVGHSIGVLTLGGLGLLAKSSINIDQLSQQFELVVGFSLVILGVWAIKRASKIVVHSHAHLHDETDQSIDHHDAQHAHSHVHVHTHGMNNHIQAHTRGHTHTAFFFGMLHGAAGAGHLFGVIPSLALPVDKAVIYLCAYCISAIFSMWLFGIILGVFAHKKAGQMISNAMYGAGSVVTGVGLFWIWQCWPV